MRLNFHTHLPLLLSEHHKIFFHFRVNLAEGVLRLVASAAPARTQSLLEYTGTRYIRESTKPPGVHRYQVHLVEYRVSSITMVPGI